MAEETPVKVVVDLSKPKDDPEREQIIPLTAEEIAERAAMAEQAAAEQAAREEEAAAKAASLESAKAKLAALGLSDDEVNAMLGLS